MAVLREDKRKSESFWRFPFVVPPSGGLGHACPPPAEAGTTNPDALFSLNSHSPAGSPKALSDLGTHNTSVIILAVNSKQMKKWLERHGATFAPGKGSHLKVFLNGKQSVLPMHGASELGKSLEAAIKRQLGLK
jgi:mRNA interferase HicA